MLALWVVGLNLSVGVPSISIPNAIPILSSLYSECLDHSYGLHLRSEVLNCAYLARKDRDRGIVAEVQVERFLPW